MRSLVESIYEAAVEPGRWPAALAQLTTALGGERAALGFAVLPHGRCARQVDHNVDPEFSRQWAEEFGGIDCWTEGGRRRGVRPGSVVTGAELFDPEEFFATALWRSCFGRYGVDDSLSFVLGGPPDHRGFVSVFRSRARGFFGPEERRRAESLVRHVMLAASTHAKLASAFQQEQLDLAASPVGIALVDERGYVQTWNAEAHRIADARDGLAYMRSKLVAIDQPTQRRIEDAISRAKRPAEQGGEGSVIGVARRSGAPSYRLCVLPVPRGTGERLFAWTTRPPAALVVVRDPEQPTPPDAAALRRLFDLTPTLARLALCLAGGRSLAEYAADEGVSAAAAARRLRELLALTGADDEATLRRALSEPATATTSSAPRRR